MAAGHFGGDGPLLIRRPAYGNLLFRSMRAVRRAGKTFPTRLHKILMIAEKYNVLIK